MTKSGFFIIYFVFWMLFIGQGNAQLVSPLDYLNAMTQAHKTLNYEQIYILQEGEKSLSWRYRQANFEQKRYAQLLKLDHVRHEIILQDQQVAYFGDFAPFSLKTHQILDNLPSVLNVDFNDLSEYSLLDLGRSRIANRAARIIRIVPNDEFRYQYVVWIDEETHLLLKSELLDREKNLLEEFRVLQSIVDDGVKEIISPISALRFPPIHYIQASEAIQMAWRPKWLPKGFKRYAQSDQSIAYSFNEDEQLESQFYSDGLFSFTLYVVENKGFYLEEQFWRDGKMSIYSQTIGDKDVIVIGEIPLASARHIVQEMEFMPSLNRERQ